jgi:hypothetical protein
VNRRQIPLDPEPFEDADSGARFTVEQARAIVKLLQYRPRSEFGYADDDMVPLTVAQCNHGDMACPPGECADLYPPHRESRDA